MSTVIIYDRYALRRGTAADLAAVNEVLHDGEMCVETDTTWAGGGRKFKIGDGSTAWNDLDYAVPDATGSDGTIDPSTTDFDFHDFRRLTPWIAGGTTAVAPVFTAVGAGRPGLCTISTGAGATASAVLTDESFNWLLLGGGEIVLEYGFRIPVLSTALERFSLQLGLRDEVSAGGTNVLYLIYRDNFNSGNWQLRSVVGGVETLVNAASGPAANTFYRLRIVINAGGTSAEFFINGVSIGTTTAIPAAALRRNIFLGKSVGTTARTADIDFATYKQTFSTPR